jgi:3-oxoacyl-[acyl-carrier-protein] synthase II
MFKPYVITGIGIVSPYGEGNSAFFENYKVPGSVVRETDLFNGSNYKHTRGAFIPELNPKKNLGLTRTRMFDRLTLILMEAIQFLLADYGFKDNSGNLIPCSGDEIAGIIGMVGPIKSISDCDFQVIKNPQFVMPSDFPNCVSCAALGYASIRNKIKRCNITLTNGETSSLDALGLASYLLENKKAKMIIAGGVEELTTQYALIMQNKHEYANLPNPILGEGSVVVSCEDFDFAKNRGARILAEVIGYSTCFCPDPEAAVSLNYAMLKNDVGEKVFNSISDAFWSEKQNVVNEKKLLPKLVVYHDLSEKIGYLYSSIGAFKVAAALASDKISSRALVLINDIDYDGNTSSLLLKKH